MATFDYNPLTGQLDLVGSGGASYINGVVADSSLLPTTLGTPSLDSVYLAKAGSGVWLINRKPAGLYVRVANNGNAADWTYLGAFPEVNADGNWELYNSTDPTKELKFDLSGLPTATTVTLTAPTSGGTIARTADIPSASSTTPAALGTAAVGVGTTFARADHVHSADVSDSAFRVSDNGDSTKKVALECSGISASTTRTWTVANRSGTVVVSDTSAGTGSDVVNNIVSLTQAEYNAIGSPDAATLYLITDP